MGYFHSPSEIWGLQKPHRVDSANKSMGSDCTLPSQQRKQISGVRFYKGVEENCPT